MSAVMSTGRQLDSAERDWTLERHLDASLFHAVLPVQTRCPRDGATAEVTLDCREKETEREEERERERE